MNLQEVQVLICYRVKGARYIIIIGQIKGLAQVHQILYQIKFLQKVLDLIVILQEDFHGKNHTSIFKRPTDSR